MIYEYNNNLPSPWVTRVHKYKYIKFYFHKVFSFFCFYFYKIDNQNSKHINQFILLKNNLLRKYEKKYSKAMIMCKYVARNRTM